MENKQKIIIKSIILYHDTKKDLKWILKANKRKWEKYKYNKKKKDNKRLNIEKEKYKI